MFFCILYFQYNGGSGLFFVFFTFQSTPKRFTFSTLVGPFFFFPFFLLRPTPKQESKQKKKDTKSKLKQNLSYHSLLSPQDCMFLCKTFFVCFLLSLTGISYQWHKQNDLNSAPIFICPETQAHTHSFISSGGQLYFSELAPSDDSTYYCSVVLTSLGGTGTYIGSSRAQGRTSLGVRLHVSSGGKGRHGAHHSSQIWNMELKKCPIFCCCQCCCFSFFLFVIFDL